MGKSHWNTQAEIEFLQGMGSHRETHYNPLPLLKGYLRGARERFDWGNINSLEVIREAERLIRGRHR